MTIRFELSLTLSPAQRHSLAGNRDTKGGYTTGTGMVSHSLRKVWRPLARSGCWLFFPFTSASVHDDQDDKDAPLQSNNNGHNRHRATTTITGSTEASSDTGQSTWSLPLPLQLPVELDANAATIVLAFVLGSATTLGASTVYRRFFKRIRNAEWITPDLFGRKRWITGVVTRSACQLL